MLCNLKRKSQIRRDIQNLIKTHEERRAKETALIDPRAKVNVKKIAAEDAALQREIDVLQQELNELETRPDRKIGTADVMEITRVLQQPLSKKEAQEIIWEVMTCSANRRNQCHRSLHRSMMISISA
jgi:hypothetical protein